MFTHVWPPALAFTGAQRSLEAPPLEMFVLFSTLTEYRPYWFCQLLAQFSHLAQHCPACLCLFDRLGNFFPSPSKASVAATTQPSTAPPVTKA